MKIKKFLAILLGVMLLLGCITGAVLASESMDGLTGRLTDGVYSAASMGKNGDVHVTVTVTGGQISAVEVGEHSDDLDVCQAAIDTIPGEIVEAQSVAVDAVSGATYTSTAIIEAVKLCIEQAGGDADDWSKPVEKSGAGVTEEYEADVVIVGAGAAGCPAALSAAQSGAKVVVVEKSGTVGGSGTRSMGVGAYNSAQQQADPDTTFTAADWLADWLAQQNYMVSGPMIYTYIVNSGETVDWLEENGASFTFVGHSQQGLMDDPIRTYHTWNVNYGTVAAGLIERAEALGAVVLLNTAGKEVLMEDGAVAGLRAEKADGTEVIIRAKAVILCTGGYGASSDALVELLGFKVNGINIGTQTGDGIVMGQAVGAALDGEDSVEFHGAHVADDLIADVPDGAAMLDNTAMQPTMLFVNMDGDRFVNEDIVYDTAYIGNATAAQGDHFYALFDQAQLDMLTEQGVAGYGITKNHPFYGMGTLTSVDAKWTGLAEQLEAGLESGATYKADTLEELAEMAGINAKSLVQTTADYNAFCAAGEDGMYGKDPQFLIPVETGPYYLVTCRSTELCTLGGLKITTRFEVVDTDNQVIPGLYSAGVDCSGSLYNGAYVSYEGVTMGWSVTSGRQAGIEAAAYAAD